MKKILFFLSVVFQIALFADKVVIEESVKAPWFTGPLLAPSAFTIPPQHYNLEPYVFAVANTGVYGADWKTVNNPTFWNNYLLFLTQIGLTSFADCQISPTINYNFTRNVQDVAFGDLPIILNLQIYKHVGAVKDWSWALKFFIHELFPTGKYQNLALNKWGTDVGGSGLWKTTIGFILGNIFYLGDGHFLSWRTVLGTTFPASTTVKNLNAFGGGPGTKGTVSVSQSFQFDTSVEINLNRNWVFALDIAGIVSGSTRFEGVTSVSNAAPSSVQLSLAPALEYNWNQNLGMIFGSWFTVAGRNSTQFVSGVVALNYYH